MPELSPKQLAIWLLIAAAILFVGARALRGEPATRIDAGLELDGSKLDISGDADAASGGPERLQIHVAGAVRRPGLYRLRAGSRVGDALRRAGGETGPADLEQINLAAPLEDGQQILVPRRGQVPAGATGPLPPGSPPTASSATGSGGDQGAPVVLSVATAAELETIDGIGPVTAAKILEFRDSQGPVNSIEQLDQIPGVGPATMETLRNALVP